MLHRLGLFGEVDGAGADGIGARTTSASVPEVPLPEVSLQAVSPPEPALVLGPLWDRLPSQTRAAVRDPVRLLARAGRQTDATTCGSAVLVMLAAAGDPVLALWLASGLLPEDPDRRRPPELVGAPSDRLVALADASAEHRFAVLQRVVKHRTDTGALLGLRWPASFGTPPWGAVRVARFGGLRFGHRVIDDTDPGHLDEVLHRVEGTLARGVPVPLYTGGDTARGWSTAVPRHVVLAVPKPHAEPHTGALTVWEPSVGHLLTVGRSDLMAGRPHRALGGWSHLTWAVLPGD